MGVGRQAIELATKAALKARLPVKPIYQALKAARIARRPSEFIGRRRAARRVLDGSAWRNFIPRDQGYRITGPGELPGIDDVVAAGRAALDRHEQRFADMARPVKSFFANILSRDDLRKFPALMEFAVSPPLVEAATGYLGSLPRLNGIGVYVSPANDSHERSQLYHVDYADFAQVKCFVNINDVAVENGPFTFIPADRSRAIRAANGHGYRSSNLPDARIGGAEPLALTGPAGTTGLVDTSNCLHFGSRVRRGRRVVFMCQYTTWPRPTLTTDKSALDGRPVFDFPPVADSDRHYVPALLGPMI